MAQPSNLALYALDGELCRALYAVLDDGLLGVVAVYVVCKLRTAAREMDGVELAADGADAAADALVLVNGSRPAAETAGGLQLDLLLGEGDTVILEGAGLALVMALLLTGRGFELFKGDLRVMLVKLLEISEVAGKGQTVPGVDIAVDADSSLAGGSLSPILSSPDSILFSISLTNASLTESVSSFLYAILPPRNVLSYDTTSFGGKQYMYPFVNR